MTNGSPSLSTNPGLRVLVADDYQDNAETWAMLLRMAGHEVAIALDGEEALQAASQQFPDAALLDLWMPRLDGFATATRLLAAAPQKLLLIAITGSNCPDDRRRCETVGFNYLFTKPADPMTILQLLRDFATSRHVDPNSAH
jgi:CheY-like chemotaxis protein